MSINIDWRKLRGIGAAILLSGLSLPSHSSSQVFMDADSAVDPYTRILSKGYGIEETSLHPGFKHITQVWDYDLRKFVFVFTMHKDIDGDGAERIDRQRLEIKTYGPSPENMKASYGETHTYRWKFKLDAGFQPSPNFCHIHQLKAGDGPDADLPLMTITPRTGTPNKLQLIFTAPVEDGGGTTTLTQVDLAPFLGTWVEVYEKVKYDFNSTYEIVIKRVSDEAVLLSYSNTNINMWRTGTTFVRPKYGIYRSLNSISYLRDESVFFADFSLAEGAAVILPVAPGNLSAMVTAGDKINLAWTDNSNDEDQFRIDRSTDSLDWSYLATVKMNGATYADTGLIASTPFYYRVRAENTFGNSDYAAAPPAILPGVPPAAPGNLAAACVSRSQINLTWTDNSDNESAFRLERSTDAGATWSVVAAIGANNSSYSDSGLSDSTMYYYRVRAENAYGNSDYSNTANATTQEVGKENLALNKPVTASSEPQPENPASSAVDGNTDTRWSASEFPQWLEVDLGSLCTINKTEVVAYSDRAYQYIVEAKTTADGSYTKVVDRSANITPGTVASPISDVFAATDARYVRITISGASGYTGVWASLLEFRVFGAVPTGVSADAAIPLDFTLQNYPNPFNPTTALRYQLPANSFVTLKVYDGLGREIATLVNQTEGKGMHTLVWNADGYASGTYLARLTAGNVTRSVKMILVK